MKKYLISKIENNKFKNMITILDYRVKITNILSKIKLKSKENEMILVDLALCSGINEFRFLEVSIDCDGKLNLSKYRYVDVDNNLLTCANNILKKEPLYVKNSILTENQVSYILNGGNN